MKMDEQVAENVRFTHQAIKPINKRVCKTTIVHYHDLLIFFDAGMLAH